MKRFGPLPPPAPRASNVDIARDFMDLSFRLESGRRLPRFSRFEGPISVRVTGPAGAHLIHDLQELLQRLRLEAGIAIALQSAERPANVTIAAISRKQIRKLLPQAACFVVPNVSSLDEFRRKRGSAALDWTTLTRRDRVTIFVPHDSSPQDIRDCLHEELAQAIGPLNDLYRLSNSVFNDDNMHAVLTGFDMLILRASYDAALSTGMSPQQVAERLPAILARLHPAGEARPYLRPGRTPRGWIEAIQQALGPAQRPALRRQAAHRALRIARNLGWQDHRHGFAHFARGRILYHSDPAQSRTAFARAGILFAARPGHELHQAHVAAHLARFALMAHDPARVMDLVIPAEAVAAAHQNAALLATLMLLRAEALALSGQTDEAEALRMDSHGWARYGFGAQQTLRAVMRDIADLPARKSPRG